MVSDSGYSTGPGAVDSVYSHIFLPCLASVAPGQDDEVPAHLRADHIGSDYV